ncbi:MAG: DNA polymerase II large subunit [Candidatus Lokiarchaeota archaeon]|nr:DNA polymerase II large subunit [Candidatus Lokiarchaeota archaeon]
MVVMSEEMEEYFNNLQKKIKESYDIAEEARDKGYDPELYVESPQAKDLAGRVEKLVGPKGVAELIRKLKTQGKAEDFIVFQVVSDILDQKIGNIEKLDDRVERAIRVGLAIKTMGVVSAPLEGISKILIKTDHQGKKYLSLYFAGPIRAAGGTTAGLCVLIADFVRNKSNIPKYEATEGEIGRYVEEVKLYDRRVHLQYPSSNNEIRFAVEHLPVEINGDSTEEEEVSAFRDLPRLETNKIRGGACLVLNDGILLKASKLLKIAELMKLEGWDWLEDLKKISNKDKQKEDSKEKEDYVVPNSKYIADVIAGRPVFSHPSRIGGHRLRYGRSRNTGLAAGGMHPASMVLLDNFVAIGTQLRIERPGKSTSICPVSSIEPPIVKLKNGNVIRVDSINKAQKIFPNIKKILFIGDILFGYGEFSENNHKLIPSGYVEEWWILELKKKIEENNEDSEEFKKFIENPFDNIPIPELAIKLSLKYKIPLHPKYLDYWGNLDVKELKILREEFKKGFDKDKNNIIIQNEENTKKILEKAFIIHKVKDNQIYFDIDMTNIYIEIFNLLDYKNIEIGEQDNIFSYFNKITPIKIKNKAPYFIGSRMGRPEKSERKTMKGIHTLFPLSDVVGNTRLVEKAMEAQKIKINVCRRICPQCKTIGIFNTCQKCNSHTELTSICVNCKKFYPKVDPHENNKCPQCKNLLKSSNEALFNIRSYVNLKLKNIKGQMPKKMKGIIGLSNIFKVPEPIEKGILRAKNEVLVYKTAEVRYDATDIPLTHFKPREIGVSVEKLKELGYKHDYKGNRITDDNQIIELRVQDILLSDDCAQYLIKVAKFLDDELEEFYLMERYYNIENRDELIGHLTVGLAPHTSAGIIGRIIGFSPARSIYAHPYWHAAKRRNCISGSEELIVWDSDKKQIILKQIGEIVEELINKGAKTKIVDDFGTIEVENLFQNWRVISIDPMTKKSIFQPIKHWIKGNSDKWIQIKTQTGRTIKMTPNHQMIVWNQNNQSFEKRKADTLREGDIIPQLIKPNIPIKNPPEFINILKELSQNLPNKPKFHKFKHSVRLRYASDWIKSIILQYAKRIKILTYSKDYQRIPGNVRELIKKILPPEPYKNPLTYDWYKSIPLSHLESLQKKGLFKWKEIPKDCKLAMARDDFIINPYLKFNTELMRYLGYFISEGYIRDEPSAYQINISVPNPDLREHVKELIINIFESEPYHKKDNDQLVHSGRIHAYLFAYAWNLGLGAYSKNLPDFIYNLPEEYRIALLSAYIDGDGCIPSTDKAILLYSVSKNLLNKITLLLSTLGILGRYRKKPPSGRYGKKILNRYKELGKEPKNSTVYRIAIRGPDLSILKKLILKAPNRLENSIKIVNKGYSNDYTFKISDGSLSTIKIIDQIVYDPIDKIKIENKHNITYCLEIKSTKTINTYNNFSTNNIITANCDGDEDAIMLLLDPLLNFSRNYLPSKIGGRMDATLVISTLLDPNEVDSEAHNIDTLYKYPLEFYEATERYVSPNDIENIMNIVKKKLGTKDQYENIGYNIPTDDINQGPKITAYKLHESMDEKIEAQLHLAKIIKAVDAKNVAIKILSTHFSPDILGNLRKFSLQKFRCVKCNTKFRRPPISSSGKCPKCGNKVILTVNRGGIEKYIPRAIKLCEEFKLDEYTQQRIELIKEYVTSLTNNPKIKQQRLSDFF